MPLESSIRSLFLVVLRKGHTSVAIAIWSLLILESTWMG